MKPVLTCSCDKHQILLSERQKIEAEIKSRQEELDSYDAKFMQIKMDPAEAVALLNRQNKELASRNSMIEQEIATLDNNCADGLLPEVGQIIKVVPVSLVC
jgi:DNA repair exonuclease SbcCD ATPase subunit